MNYRLQNINTEKGVQFKCYDIEDVQIKHAK